MNSRARALLVSIVDHSPYLWRLVQAAPERMLNMLDEAPQAFFQTTLKEMRDGEIALERDEVASRIRVAKQKVALLVALADLGGAWDLAQVTEALTRYAEAAVSFGLAHLLRESARAHWLEIDEHDPEKGCGLVVLALGKLGAGELNYSSDIDLVVLFDPECAALRTRSEPAPLFVRLTQSLARLLQERTGEGYGLRVDLRLRPDPGSTSVAIALRAAFGYYETVGQNWERAALIKARPIAGDVSLGRRFLHDLAPFIWRKYFDYASIADIHAMKRQIHAVRGHEAIAVAGHDIKLGRGGIREVEFFVQTQQLIFGGRRPSLRGCATLDMLRELQADGWVSAQAVAELSEAYVFLREVEHRLQMVDDEQTQRLPPDPEALARFALFCGFAGLSQFSKALLHHLGRVEWHYARLFENAPGLDAALGSLVFTGVVDDPETLETLRGMGFRDPSKAAETVRGWHFGRRAAVQSARAREVLTELVPSLLACFARSGDPDAALAAFDAALSRMPAAVELFSILRSNEKVRELFGDILGAAPRLAEAVVARPHLLDAAIDPAMVRVTLEADAYEERADNLLSSAKTSEDFLDGARDLAQEEAFLIGVRLLSNMFDASQAGRAYTSLAESILRATLGHVAAAFEKEHGRPPRGRCVVIGLGRLGSREMTAGSDLDLILLYDFDASDPHSRGGRPLHAAHYYTRLTQRLISALTVATRRGRLYDVDMRLRPSGRQGPLATQLRAFVDYQKGEAECWEHMSLCRARVVAGDQSLAQDARRAIADVLAMKRDPVRLRSEIVAMRSLIAREKGDQDHWDLKLVSGGLTDIEFIAQYLVLRHCREHNELMNVETECVLTAAARLGLLDAESAQELIAARRLFVTVMQMTRVALAGRFEPAGAATGALRRIAAAAGLPDFARLEAQAAEMRAGVRAAFERMLAPDEASANNGDSPR